MKTPLPKPVRTALLAVAVFAGCLVCAGEPDQILFLHLKIQGDAITCLDSSVRPGRLKTPVATERKGSIYLELVSTNGAAVWSEVIADPAVRRLEYEDPAHPGTLKIKEVNLTETEFTVRVPFRRDETKLRVHRLEKPSSRSEVLARVGLSKPIATIAIQQKESTP
jgi:hypothetical protein